MAEAVHFFCPSCWAEVPADAACCPRCAADLTQRADYRTALERALSHPEPQTARRAAYLLGRLGDTAAVPALIAVLDGNDPYVAAEAVIALGRIGTPAARHAVVAARAHRFAAVRRAAREAGGESSSAAGG